MIKILAFDVYGTIIAYDPDNDYRGDFFYPPRKGLEVLLKRCQERNIQVVTSSDADDCTVQADLAWCFNRFPERELSLDKFNKFFWFPRFRGIKDYSIIARHYNISPKELLVFDDRQENIESALEIGSKAVLVPEYLVRGGIEWSFESVDIDKI